MNNFFSKVGHWMVYIGVSLFGAALFFLGAAAILNIWVSNNSANIALDIAITLFAAGVPMWIVGIFIIESTD